MKTDQLKHAYSDGISNKRIVIFGPYPPPLGGVAIHVRRVMAKLKRQHNQVVCFDTTAVHRCHFKKYLLKLTLFLITNRPHKVFYNTIYLGDSLIELRLIFLLQNLFRFQVTLIEHNCRHIYKRSEQFKRTLGRMMQKNKIILIGDSTYQSYQDAGVLLPKHLELESPFLSPDTTREQEILSTYPKDLFAFMASKRPLIVINGFQLSLLNGKDLYGFDFAVDLVHKLKNDYPKVGLVIVLGRIGNVDYLERLYRQIGRLQVWNSIYILHGDKELWPLLKRADLFVRPTLSDSFGISILEALELGVLAVASDVCARPEGTILFGCGNKDDFFSKVYFALGKKGDSSFIARQKEASSLSLY